MSWVTALRNSPQRFLYDLARRSADLHVPNLLTSDQATVNSLRWRTWPPTKNQ
jgi:hypothetical protein